MDEIENCLAPQQPSTLSVDPCSKSNDAGRSVIRQLFEETNISKTSDNLSVEVSEFADLVIVPRSVLDGIWQKAHELVVHSDAISCAPGYDKGYMHGQKLHRKETPPSDSQKQ